MTSAGATGFSVTASRPARSAGRQSACPPKPAATGPRDQPGTSLGFAELHLGNLAAAATSYERALAVARELRERFHEAEILTNLGDARHAADALTQAREAWQQALVILRDLEHPTPARFSPSSSA
jgi:tetratricopeptide (TPR) repeat protein